MALSLRRSALAGCALAALWTGAATAQTATEPPAKVAPGAEAEAAPVVLLAPPMAPPLTLNPAPYAVDAGVLGKIYIGGQLTGLGLVQSDRTPNSLPQGGNSDALLDLGDAMVSVQKTDGMFQFAIQAGTYAFPTLGTPYLRPGKNTDAYYGPVPVAYGKVVFSPKFSIQAGSMYTLIGSEYAFTYQNTNIERGLLWNQEPVISKGVQANYADGPLSVSVSINDGFFSDHYNWFSGLLTYVIDSHNTVAINGGFNFAHTATTKFRAPNAQNNSGLFLASYTYSNGPLWISPYFQYTTVPADPRTGVQKDAQTFSGAVLAKYSFTPEISLGGRFEYISTQSDGCRPSDGPFCAPTNLLYGPGSDAWTLTATPTWQKGIFFARGEVSYVRIENFTPGFGFGANFNSRDQVRGLFEVGVLF